MTKPMRRIVHTINIKDNKTLREVIVAIDRRIKHLKVGLKALQRSEIPSHCAPAHGSGSVAINFPGPDGTTCYVIYDSGKAVGGNCLK